MQQFQRPSFVVVFASLKSEAAASPTGRGGLLPGLPPADRAAQDAPEFAPRTEYTPRTKLKAAASLPFAQHAAACAAQPATLSRTCQRETCAPPRARPFVNSSRPPHLAPPAAASHGTARTRLGERAHRTGAGRRPPILQVHYSLPFLRARRRATVSGIEPTSPGFRRNLLAPARRASISTSLPESMMTGVCCR